MADKADMQGSIRVPGLGGDISQVALHSVPRLGSCDAEGAQDSSPHPCHVAGTDWRCSESLGTGW